MDDPINNSTTTRWNALFNALNLKAEELSTKFNVGAGVFPYNFHECSYSERQVAGKCIKLQSGYSSRWYTWDDFNQCIALQENNIFSDFNACKTSGLPYGGTPISVVYPDSSEQHPGALEIVKASKNYNFSPDPYSEDRIKAVVVITDAQFEGENGSPDIDVVVTATANLASDGVKVYYMGFEGVYPDNMQSLALAGKGLSSSDKDEWYPINDADSIIAALNSISASIVSCTASVELGENADPTRISVAINNNGTLEPVVKDSENGWSLNMAEKTVTLNGTSCETLTNYAQIPNATVGISIKIACDVKCEPTNGGVEICDYIDNDCNGKIDDGIDCSPGTEICGDGIDNDGDGEVDEGCGTNY